MRTVGVSDSERQVRRSEDMRRSRLRAWPSGEGRSPLSSRVYQAQIIDMKTTALGRLFYLPICGASSHPIWFMVCVRRVDFAFV